MDFAECKLVMFWVGKMEKTHTDTTDNKILRMRYIVLKLKNVK